LQFKFDTYHIVLHMINTAACLVRAHLAFCTSRCQTMIFADLKAGLIILCRLYTVRNW